MRTTFLRYVESRLYKYVKSGRVVYKLLPPMTFEEICKKTLYPYITLTTVLTNTGGTNLPMIKKYNINDIKLYKKYPR